MPFIDILIPGYERIKEHPILFFNAVKEKRYSDSEYHTYWVPETIPGIDKETRVYKEAIYSPSKRVLLAYARLQHSSNLDEPPIPPGMVRMKLEPFDSNNASHVSAVLGLYLNKAKDKSDKYAGRELIWMLNNYYINFQLLSDLIDAFDCQESKALIWQALKEYAKCLSIPKQDIIIRYLISHGINCEIYFPKLLQDALVDCFPYIDFSKENLSIFQLIHLAAKGDKYKQLPLNPDLESIASPINFFLKIRRWLKYPDYEFSDFRTLTNLFCLFSPDLQITLIKRYFHAVRCGQVEFNIELIKNFLYNKFENWSRYFHCAHAASSPIRLDAALLCDSILTFLTRNQTELQTINGVLDMAYARCDTNSPEIDFRLKNIVPICRGGATPDKSGFLGFICYKHTYILNENAFSTDSLIEIFRKYLRLYGVEKEVIGCSKDHTSPESCAQRMSCTSCPFRSDRYTLRVNENKTGVEGNNNYKVTILSLFMDLQFPLPQEFSVNPLQALLTPETVRSRFIAWCNDNLESVNNTVSKLKSGSEQKLSAGWKIKSGLENYMYLIDDFLIPSWTTIEPRRNAFIGEGLLLKEANEPFLIHRNTEEIQKKENAIILPRVVEALKERLNVLPDRNGNFQTEYNMELLRELKANFYTFKESDNSSCFYDKNVGFLTGVRSKYDRYCAPKYEGDVNFVTQLPFMWCRGKECFKPSLDNQTLVNCKSWEEYTIIHILEILGYPQISFTSGGAEASELLRNFIGLVNKATVLFKRLKCRECGHILFPLGHSAFNRYNNFECRLPSCSNKWQRVYISQCHNCKKEIIDSRDSKQCPNGWHICPKCLHCCDDEIYERMADKYRVKNTPVPVRLSQKLGKGHNNKDMFFCPTCGGSVGMGIDPTSGVPVAICKNCHVHYYDIDTSSHDSN